MSQQPPSLPDQWSVAECPGLLRWGHFRYESGHHGDLWLELERLFMQPSILRRAARDLAAGVHEMSFDRVCGPAVGGALVGQLVAEESAVGFLFSEPRVGADGEAIVSYEIPHPQRDGLSGCRVLIVDDAINAGSAVVETARAIEEAGAQVVGLAALIGRSEAAERAAARLGVPAAVLETIDWQLWDEGECPLCRDGVPLG